VLRHTSLDELPQFFNALPPYGETKWVSELMIAHQVTMPMAKQASQ